MRAYLSPDIVKGRRADDGEADEEDVGLRVREGSESVVIFLPSGIPQTQANGLAVDHHTGRVVVEPRIVSSGARQYSTVPASTYTVGMYSPGKAFVVYDIRRHVWKDAVSGEPFLHQEKKKKNTFPTAPSPVTTHCADKRGQPRALTWTG